MTLDTPNVQQFRLPPLPQIGLDPHVYDRQAKRAERDGNHHAHEAAKVGMYVSLALDAHLSWREKLKYFTHALSRHCEAPPYPDERMWLFYKELANLVRAHCGAEALRLASKEDDFYAARLSMGQSREAIADEAEAFFASLIGDLDECPDHFNEADWQTLKMIRDQWV